MSGRLSAGTHSGAAPPSSFGPSFQLLHARFAAVCWRVKGAEWNNSKPSNGRLTSTASQRAPTAQSNAQLLRAHKLAHLPRGERPRPTLSQPNGSAAILHASLLALLATLPAHFSSHSRLLSGRGALFKATQRLPGHEGEKSIDLAPFCSAATQICAPLLAHSTWRRQKQCS